MLANIQFAIDEKLGGRGTGLGEWCCAFWGGASVVRIGGIEHWSREVRDWKVDI